MRLLQVSLRSLLIYSLLVVLISIPISIFSIREILNEEVDESLQAHTEQFLRHIKSYEYLEDLDTDLHVFDQLSYDIQISEGHGNEVVREFKTISGYDSLEQEERPLRQLSSSVVIKGKPYILTVSLSLVDNEELVWAIGSVQAFLIILLATGLLLLNRSLSRRLWKPFYRTINQLKAYELDKNEVFTPENTNIIEFDDLNQTVSHLTARNKRIYQQQKEFIENASHELQTPLAIFQSKLDLLMQSPTLSETDATIMLEMESTAQRMARLNKSLLLLSKIDNEQFTALEDIELAVLINRRVADLKSMADIDKITLSVDVDSFTLHANKTLMEVLLTNLLHNAVRHASQQGQVFVTLHGNKLTIRNTGNPLKMRPEEMFERFRKEHSGENSTGLGLAIVKQICDTCSYQLHYQYTGNVHTFSVTF
jgi:signal transduction histidine kinase